MELSKQIQDISQGNYYSEKAINRAISLNIANNLEIKALKAFLVGHHSGDICKNIMRLQDLSIKLKKEGF